MDRLIEECAVCVCMKFFNLVSFAGLHVALYKQLRVKDLPKVSSLPT